MPIVSVFIAALLAATLIGCGESALQGPQPGVNPGDKVLRTTFQVAETGFDPVKVSDYYSSVVISAIFDPLLTYDYLARPAKLVPNVATALPEITDGGKTY